MNYIKHLTGFFDKLVQDDRLNPTHISLYLALFQFWNVQRFKNPISISRAEVMRISKIASKATYHKCMRELHEFGFLTYDPSFNPYRGSLVTIHNLELTHQEVQKKNKLNTKKKTSREQVIEQPAVPLNEPFNKLNKQTKSNKTSKSNVKGENLQIGNGIPPSFEEVRSFFQGRGKPILDAEKFYNYFESNGWLVGGRTKMKNWQAAAKNWILNANSFSKPSPKNILHATQNKDYNVPL